MNYTEYNISTTEEGGEILVAFLADMGFDSFSYEDGEQLCYILDSELEIHKAEIEEYLSSENVCYSVTKVETKNWNKEWESNFEPITVGDRLCVRAPFHERSECQQEIIIMPKMSFGTGHHATTYQMLEAILDSDLQGKRVLDMGCGSAILAILAASRGAGSVLGIDIDDWAVENSIENISDNGYSDKIEVALGDASSIKGLEFDTILANINRNILLRDMPLYRETMSSGGELFVSGFLEIDAKAILACAQKLGFSLVSQSQLNGWVVMKLSL